MKEEQIAHIRAFNRFYTAVIGLLDNHYLSSDFTLTEGRIMYEIYYQPDGITASTLIEKLNLDKSYLSRILHQFEESRLIEKKRSDDDKRSFDIFLSRSGKLVFEKLNSAAQHLAAQLLLPLKNAEIVKLIGHMEAIMQIFTNANM